MKATGERNAGNPHVAFEVAGAGNGMMDDPKRARNRKRGNKQRVYLHIAAPVLDPTGAIVNNEKWIMLARHLFSAGAIVNNEKWIMLARHLFSGTFFPGFSIGTAMTGAKRNISPRKKERVSPPTHNRSRNDLFPHLTTALLNV